MFAFKNKRNSSIPIFCNIHRKAPVLECLFNKVADLQDNLRTAAWSIAFKTLKT